eukprot:TRINITY_DN30059_c0_g1_i1.p1 TRINITY_DN30059_c0_g1~~TRINITY_DN30059_c0_g1_i1.p1  ORF type:complete len:104 (-),score=20.25 TRINITY_DN30059_c0_g1_i1:177-488(-)
MAQEALKCELSYLQRVCRVSNELMAVGITLQPHQQQHHNRTTTKVETASTNVLLAPVLPNSESQLDALLGGVGGRKRGMVVKTTILSDLLLTHKMRMGLGMLP